ncbi:YIP1 family protein [Paenibacillus sp. CAA11]|uniref:Yip1 family protein n=1 Tax=Paenibacillus sp. CAA11 TaxID=1532905 RepID=UPI000D3B079F|nr:Yip1 family protein [Paenibacillus sp. CAA11]AWB44681.1 YIP1 family protein [Paenibacillus sp. CAA11]
MSLEPLKYPLYLIVHPFNAYWEHKYERNKRQDLITSFVILFLMILTNVLGYQYSGFLVNMNNPLDMNSLMEAVYVIVPVLFWCVANWSLTTLMEGEGKFTEIFTSTCFALVPMIIINFPWIWLSNVISIQETTFYYFSQSLAILWSMYLLFVGNMTVHQYSPSKTITTIFLTILAMGFLAFICLLFFGLIRQIVSFADIIYQEITMRSS